MRFIALVQRGYSLFPKFIIPNIIKVIKWLGIETRLDLSGFCQYNEKRKSNKRSPLRRMGCEFTNKEEVNPMKKGQLLLLALAMLICVFLPTFAEENKTIDLSNYSFQQLISLRQQIDSQFSIIATNTDHSDYSLDGLIFVSNGSEIRINAYEGTNPDLIIPDEIDGIPVTQIHNSAFKGTDNISSVVLPDWMTVIPEEFFRGCTKLKTVYIPDAITEIGYMAFGYCRELQGVIILPTSLSSFGSHVFIDTKISGVVVQSNVTIGGNQTFTPKTMKFLYVREGYKVDFTGTPFYEGLELAIIPASVTSIGDDVFGRCNNLIFVCPAGSYAEKYARQHFIMCDTEHYDQFVQEYESLYSQNN